MRAFLATTCVVTAAMLTGGCATKNYVRNTTTPIQAKVDQVGEQTNKNGEQIEDTRKQLKDVDGRTRAAQDSATAADQHAGAADQHATDAMSRANLAHQLGEQNAQGLESLRNVIANLDDYKMDKQVTVAFAFDRYELNGYAKDDLEKIAEGIKNHRRYFIVVEGYTDATGSKTYNETLSQRRADQVVQFLVTKYDVPLFRIHMIGLGQQRPVDDAKNRTARARNRRVEVKIFSADPAVAGPGAQARAEVAPLQR